MNNKEFRLHSADFELNTLTIQLDANFWDRFLVTPGIVSIDIAKSTGIRVQKDEI